MKKSIPQEAKGYLVILLIYISMLLSIFTSENTYATEIIKDKQELVALAIQHASCAGYANSKPEISKIHVASALTYIPQVTVLYHQGVAEGVAKTLAYVYGLEVADVGYKLYLENTCYRLTSK